MSRTRNQDGAGAIERRNQDPRYQRLVAEEQVILDITESLTEAMNEAGLTREDVAEQAGVHPGALQRELEGAAGIPLRDLIRVAAAVGLKPKLAHAPELRRRRR